MLLLETTKMDITVKLPTLNQKDKTIAEIIVVLLIEEWPLSPKGLYNRVIRRHSKVVSFQAVHKAVKKLEAEEIIIKKDKYYKLNPEWLKQITTFGNQVASDYEKNEVHLKGLP
jgi:hypothetical protein